MPTTIRLLADTAVRLAKFTRKTANAEHFEAVILKQRHQSEDHNRKNRQNAVSARNAIKTLQAKMTL